MRLLRSLLFSAARHSFSFSSQHVPGVNNQLADDLSRFNWEEFWHLVPDAQPRPTVVPPDLVAHYLSTLEQQCHSFLTQGLAPSMRQSYAFAQAQFILFCTQLGKLHSRAPHAQLIYGHCSFLLLSWLQEFSTPPLRSTCPGLELSTLNRGFQTPWSTATAFRGWSAVSSTLRAPCLLPACLLLMT